MLSDPDTAALASIRAALMDVTLQVQTAQAKLDTGGPVDMAGMDRQVSMLCRQALALPPPIARETLPDLQALRGVMDTLIETLARHQRR